MMFGASGIMVWAGIGLGNNIWLAMPVFGALVSTSFVNLNTLTQIISRTRQELANSIYRTIGTIAGVVAPFFATWLASLAGYNAVFWACAGLLGIAGFAVMRYPGEPEPEPLSNWRAELTGFLNGYRTVLKQKPLMRFIHFSQLWSTFLGGVGVFIVIRFTRELGLTDRQLGLIISGAGVVAAGVTVAGIFFLDRIRLHPLFCYSAVICGLAATLTGIADSVLLTAIGIFILTPLGTMLNGPLSMWISRSAGESSQTAAFSIHKLVTVLYTAAGMFMFGLLEQRFGIRPVLLGTGISSTVIAIGFFFLPEPPDINLAITVPPDNRLE